MNNIYQKSCNRTALTLRNKGEASIVSKQGSKVVIATQDTENSPNNTNKLMEVICDRENLRKALKCVCQNKGSPGVDGMTIDELIPYLKENWSTIKQQLLEGKYQPQPVKRVEIPKAGSKDTRKLGIPIVLDRFISQAILQVLQNKIDCTFSEYSYGFRPGKSAHQAISKAKEYVSQGYKIVVDIDLEKFFDRVNHDKLMSEIAKHIKDKRLLKLFRQFLTIGILENGLITPSDLGMPQGNPLSPLLSNLMLDILDKELIKRKHKFCRFADDCNIYVRSLRAGQRVMSSIMSFIEKKLKLKVNQTKSAVDKTYKRQFLGFAFTNNKAPKIRIAPKAIKRFKDKVRGITITGKAICMENVIENMSRYSRGWLAYFSYCQTPSTLDRLKAWMQRKLRCAYWRQWKNGKNRFKQLRKLGVEYDLANQTAGTNKGPWRISNSPGLSIALTNAYFRNSGIPNFVCRTG